MSTRITRQNFHCLCLLTNNIYYCACIGKPKNTRYFQQQLISLRLRTCFSTVHASRALCIRNEGTEIRLYNTLIDTLI